MPDMSNTFSEDDTFAKLYAMDFDGALDLAIKVTNDVPLGTNEEERIRLADTALQQYGWSYKKLMQENFRRTSNGRN